MNDIFWDALTLLVYTIPLMALTYIPFCNKVRVKTRWAVAFNTFIFILHMGVYVFFASSHFLYNFLRAYKLILIIPGALITFTSIHESKFKIFYFNLMMITYIVVSPKPANFFIFRMYKTPSNFEHTMVNICVLAVMLPLMILYQNWIFKLTDEAVEASETDVGKIIWGVPLLFLLLCLSSNIKFDPAVIREPQLMIMNLLTVAGMFILTSALLWTLTQVAEILLLRKNSKMAEQQLIMQGQ